MKGPRSSLQHFHTTCKYIIILTCLNEHKLIKMQFYLIFIDTLSERAIRHR